MLVTHDYKKNPESPVGNELDVNEGDTLVYLMTNEDNEHWWLAEDGKRQVGYSPGSKHPWRHTCSQSASRPLCTFAT